MPWCTDNLLLFSVSPLAELSEESINRTLERGDTAMLQCTSLGGPNNTYQWRANGVLLTETSQNLSISNIMANDGGVYTCEVSNFAGNHTASTFVYVNPYIVSEPVGSEFVIGASFVLTFGVKSFPNPEYLWQRRDGQAIDSDILMNGSNFSIPSIQYGDEGEYYSIATSRGTSVMSQFAVITGKYISALISV
jgi:hypothetical protein